MMNQYKTLCLLIGVALLGASPIEAKAKNVVLIVADDLGFQQGCYGDTMAQTPAIDRLAQEGVRFTNSYCTSSSCSASRSVILTGLYNHATGHYGHSHSWFHFSTYESVRSLPLLMKEAGYRTVHVGKYHLAPKQVYHFDNYLSEEDPKKFNRNRNTVKMANAVGDWIGESSKKPFFVYYCPYDPHHGPPKKRKRDPFDNINEKPNPYKPTKRTTYDPKKVECPWWLNDEPRSRFEYAEYYQAVNRVDQGVGRLVKILKEKGLYEDTIIIFTSDNGPPFPGAKTTLYQPGSNVPMIIRAPGTKRIGEVTESVTSHVNIVPTILDYCGITPGKGYALKPVEAGEEPDDSKKVAYMNHGKSMMPVLNAEPKEGWDEAFLSHSFHQLDWYNPMRSLRQGKFKYYYNINHLLPQPFVLKYFDAKGYQGKGKEFSQVIGGKPIQVFIKRSRHELYNLDKDPMELNNLINNPEYGAVLSKMKDRTRELQRETSDPWVNQWGGEEKMKVMQEFMDRD
ncbi:MAG: sulfatase [Planctomycetes bacterium]|nr:sulfatase [Planctomycetota bacterium]